MITTYHIMLTLWLIHITCDIWHMSGSELGEKFYILWLNSTLKEYQIAEVAVMMMPLIFEVVGTVCNFGLLDLGAVLLELEIHSTLYFGIWLRSLVNFVWLLMLYLAFMVLVQSNGSVVGSIKPKTKLNPQLIS